VGRTVRGFLRVIDYLSFLTKFFENIPFGVDSPRAFSERFEINLDSNRKVRSSGGPGGWSTGHRRMVRGFLADSPPMPTGNSDSRRLRVFTVGFKRRQSVRSSRTVREIRVLCIKASSEKWGIYTPPTGLGRLSWHFERFI
jgi:hypothetical protein